MSLTGKEENHKQLRQQVAEQLCNKPQAIAAALIEKSSSCPGVNPSSLIATFLSDESYSVFKAAKEVGKGTEDSLALAVVKEGNETKKFGSWCGMVQVYGAAAAIGCSINMHYPEVNQRIRPFMNTIVQPLESATSQNNDIHIMWSSTTQPATLKGNVQLNHFVPLLPRSATNLSYHAESDIPASDCCDESDSDKLESTFGFSDDENASEFVVMKTLRKSRKSKRIEPKSWSLSGFQPKSPRVCAIPSNMDITVETMHEDSGIPVDSHHTAAQESQNGDKPAYGNASRTTQRAMAATATKPKGSESKSSKIKQTLDSWLLSNKNKHVQKDQREITNSHPITTIPELAKTPVRQNVSSTTCRRHISKETFMGWKRSHEADYQTMSWLKCEVMKDNPSMVDILWCEVCRTYQSKVCGTKHFSRTWIDGSRNHRTNNVIDHAGSAQHQAAMSYKRKETARKRREPVTDYSEIARSFKMKPETKARMMKKFEICYFLAKENFPFVKYPSICALEKRHGVELGEAYSTDVAASHFVHYIAESQRQHFKQTVAAPFFSILMDSSADKGKVENELFAIIYSESDHTSEKLITRSRYFKVLEPSKADSAGLFDCLREALKDMGIRDLMNPENVLQVKNLPILVGVGTDGAAVNISEIRGLKAKVQNVLPWIFWMWCFAHRLELASRDALSNPVFKEIDEMLLRIYYLYNKSPKKCRELRAIVNDLKEVYNFPRGGNLPVRASGSRWIVHKRRALHRVLDRYGAYMNHLASLCEDASLRSPDRQRLKGYLTKWTHAKIILSCAHYIIF